MKKKKSVAYVLSKCVLSKYTIQAGHEEKKKTKEEESSGSHSTAVDSQVINPFLYFFISQFLCFLIEPFMNWDNHIMPFPHYIMDGCM